MAKIENIILPSGHTDVNDRGKWYSGRLLLKLRFTSLKKVCRKSEMRKTTICQNPSLSDTFRRLIDWRRRRRRQSQKGQILNDSKGRRGGQVINVLAYYSDDLSLNPADTYSFIGKICTRYISVHGCDSDNLGSCPVKVHSFKCKISTRYFLTVAVKIQGKCTYLPSTLTSGYQYVESWQSKRLVKDNESSPWQAFVD